MTKPSELDAIFDHDDGRRSTKGYCYGVEDGMDGYCVHVPECSRVGQGWSGPNTRCYRLVGDRHESWIRTPGGGRRELS